jgi:hypothetical protein
MRLTDSASMGRISVADSSNDDMMMRCDVRNVNASLLLVLEAVTL